MGRSHCISSGLSGNPPRIAVLKFWQFSLISSVTVALRKYREPMDSGAVEMAVIVRLRPELTFMVADYNRANRTELRRGDRSTNIYTISSTGQKYSTSTDMTVNPDTCIHLKKTLCSTNRAHYELYL